MTGAGAFTIRRLSWATRLSSRRLARLMDAEVLGHAMHVQEAEDKQHDGNQADECQHGHDEQREPVDR
jgi:hypothetical protein